MTTVPLMNIIASGSALIVNDLALTVTSQDLHEVFGAFGRVVWARVVVDPIGQSLRFGYVVMVDESHAARALEALNGRTIAGLPITVSRTVVPPLPRRA